jgi:hypothetical protein
VYEEFCDLTKRKLYNDYNLEMLDSDHATQVNENVKGHTDQLKAMFASDEFPEIEMPVPLTEVLLRKAIATQVILANARVKRKRLSNPRDKNSLNASKLIEGEIAWYQRQAVNLKPLQQAVLLEPRIVQWCQEPAIPRLRNVHQEVGEALIRIWQN